MHRSILKALVTLGLASAGWQRGDRVLVIMQNGYTSATGATGPIVW